MVGGTQQQKEIHLAVLSLIESGEFERIKTKWFGD